MTRATPVVIIAYNRPDKVSRLIGSLNELKPKHVIFAVDGPKFHRPGDADKVAAVQSLAARIDWTDNVELRFRPANLGLRAAVTDAVTAAISEFGQAIIMEEDTMPGPNWIPYATEMLDRHRNAAEIEHISGYNLAPEHVQIGCGHGSRLSRYPESIAWATWDRAWNQFDGSLDWAMNASTADLAAIVGSRSGALRWKQNFADAEAERISTWAYRWIASMWSRDSFVLSPNQNLVTYGGYDEGTNSVLKAPWEELPRYDGPVSQCLERDVYFDASADRWIAKNVFAETPIGVVRGAAITAALTVRKWKRERRSHTAAFPGAV